MSSVVTTTKKLNICPWIDYKIKQAGMKVINRFKKMRHRKCYSNGLKLELEPTIGNHDEEFLNYNRFQKSL